MSEFFDKPKAAGANLHSKTTNCRTCGGDRFVLVALRSAKASTWMQQRGMKVPAVEDAGEYAACPDCSTVDTSFRRHDGTIARSLDPATVREWMQRVPKKSAPTPPPEMRRQLAELKKRASAKDVPA